MNVILPTTRRTKALTINPRFLLLYSPPKCGKTTLLSKLDNNLLLDIDNAASDYLEDCLVMKADSWDELEAIGLAIIEAKKPYEYITLDNASVLDSWAEDLGKRMYLNAPMAASKYKQNPELLHSILALPGKDGGYGPGYLWHRLAYAKCLEFLMTLAKNFILIAHLKDKMLTEKTTIVADASDVDLVGKLKQITCSRADAIGFIFRKVVDAKDGEPIEDIFVSFRSTGISAGSRSRHLSGKEIRLSRVAKEEEDIIVDWDKVFIKEEGDNK